MPGRSEGLGGLGGHFEAPHVDRFAMIPVVRSRSRTKSWGFVVLLLLLVVVVGLALLTGPVLGAVPLVSALSLTSALPMLIVRTERPKEYGTARQIEGTLVPGVFESPAS